MDIKIGKKTVGIKHPTYFVADIAANHDGSLARAIDLIHLAKAAGADAAKFQNFSAENIVSDKGFKDLGSGLGHQKKWKKSVYEVYKSASIPHSWTPHLSQACESVGIEYFSAPYDFESVDMLDDYAPVYKIGSGDLNWLEMLEYIANKNKPILLATGASTLEEIEKSMATLRKYNSQVVLMQCNTNYTGSLDNFRFQNLRVLNTFSNLFPEVVLGFSDHTRGHSAVLGAVTLGARVIEKHFTDDTKREGPDHYFSLDPQSWSEMVDRTRELEQALGGDMKALEENEIESVVVQRRAIRARENLSAGTLLKRTDFTVLRPAPRGSIKAEDVQKNVDPRSTFFMV
jgi:N-acetylneuraminate synthase